MNIANNHLSKHGRFGDTEIAKTSSGDLWHVSKHEKKLIDNYGKIGEDVVDTLGSGTINPTTGLKEQWVQAALMVGQLGLSLYQGAKGTSMERDNASAKYNLAIDICLCWLNTVSNRCRWRSTNVVVWGSIAGGSTVGG